jgi:hypothetical protein
MPVLIACLALIGGLLVVKIIEGHRGTPSPWTSHARFTLSRVGTYTAADSTVPVGIHGDAEIDLGMGLTGNRKDFVATIGGDPTDDTNVSQWQLIFHGYHGVGRYQVASTSGDGGIRVMVRDARSGTDTAGCAIRITADATMKDPTIREVRGSVTCHGLYDDNRRTRTTALSSQFDVFAEVWCGGGQKVQLCRSPQPVPVLPRD